MVVVLCVCICVCVCVIRAGSVGPLFHLQAADAGVEGVVGAGHVLERAHGGKGEGGVAQAGPQDVSHTVRGQVSQAPNVLKTVKKDKLIKSISNTLKRYR